MSSLRFELDGRINSFIEDYRSLFIMGYENEKPPKYEPRYKDIPTTINEEYEAYKALKSLNDNQLYFLHNLLNEMASRVMICSDMTDS